MTSYSCLVYFVSLGLCYQNFWIAKVHVKQNLLTLYLIYTSSFHNYWHLFTWCHLIPNHVRWKMMKELQTNKEDLSFFFFEWKKTWVSIKFIHFLKDSFCYWDCLLMAYPQDGGWWGKCFEEILPRMIVCCMKGTPSV